MAKRDLISPLQHSSFRTVLITRVCSPVRNPHCSTVHCDSLPCAEKSYKQELVGVAGRSVGRSVGRAGWLMRDDQWACRRLTRRRAWVLLGEPVARSTPTKKSAVQTACNATPLRQCHQRRKYAR